FRKSVSQTLHSGCRNVCTRTTLEQGSQVVFTQELASLLIVLFLTLKHLVIEQARLIQARIQATALFSVRIEAKRIRSHTLNYTRLEVRCQTDVRVPGTTPSAIHPHPRLRSVLCKG